MIVIPVLIMLVACFIFYSTSRRAIYRRKSLNNWFLNHLFLSRLLTAIFLVFAFVLFIRFEGVGVGFFLGLVTLMTIYGYMLLFYPLERRVKT